MYRNGQIVHNMDTNKPYKVGSGESMAARGNASKNMLPYFDMVGGGICFPRTLSIANRFLKSGQIKIYDKNDPYIKKYEQIQINKRDICFEYTLHLLLFGWRVSEDFLWISPKTKELKTSHEAMIDQMKIGFSSCEGYAIDIDFIVGMPIAEAGEAFSKKFNLPWSTISIRKPDDWAKLSNLNAIYVETKVLATYNGAYCAKQEFITKAYLHPYLV